MELFFKWIKQNLKIKSFIGTSKNAVMTLIWIAMCVYLILAFLKLQSKSTKSSQQILRVLQLNLFEKRDLMVLVRGDPIRHQSYNPNQFSFLWKLTGQHWLFMNTWRIWILALLSWRLHCMWARRPYDGDWPNKLNSLRLRLFSTVNWNKPAYLLTKVICGILLNCPKRWVFRGRSYFARLYEKTFNRKLDLRKGNNWSPCWPASYLLLSPQLNKSLKLGFHRKA